MTSVGRWGFLGRSRPAGGGGRTWLRFGLRLAIVAGAGLLVVLGADLARLSLGSHAQRTLLDDRRRGGSLVIGGGGPLPDEVLDRFAELAGGPRARVVVIPTADPGASLVDPAEYAAPWRKRGVASVRVIHTLSRAEADVPDFARPLDGATGVWLTGGHQHWLGSAYAGTAVERGIQGVLARGGAVGGTSAGAAAMTRVMIDGGRGEAIEARGLDLLPGAVVDQHFLRRNRMGRLLGVLARHPGLVGFGVDERTALVVRLGTMQLDVVGDSYAVACLPGPSGGNPRLEFLKRGDRADLDSLKSSPDAITSTAGLDSLLGER